MLEKTVGVLPEEEKSNAQWQAAYWNDRFKKSDPWGAEASPVVQEIFRHSNKLRPDSAIVTFGCGLGRDELQLAKEERCFINGFDICRVGINKAAERIEADPQTSSYLGERIWFTLANVTTFPSLREAWADVFASNRVVHLLEKDEVKRFVKQAVFTAKEDALIAITARSFLDFDPNSMEWINESEGLALRDDGVITRFWNSEMFRQHFEYAVDISEIAPVEEPDTIESGRNTQLLLMTGYRLPDANIKKNIKQGQHSRSKNGHNGTSAEAAVTESLAP